MNSLSVPAELEARVLLSAVTQVGLHHGRQFSADTDNTLTDDVGDTHFFFGTVGDKPFVGDWDGDGFDEAGIFRGGRFYLDLNGNSAWDGIAGGDGIRNFGTAGDTPYIGDWEGNGIDNIGVVRNGVFYLDSNGNGVWEGLSGGDFYGPFGNSTDIPIAGDWAGIGRDNIGVFRSGTFYLDVNGNGIWDSSFDARFEFGISGDVPVIGDWNGDGLSDPGVFRKGTWYTDENGNRAWNNIAGGDGRFGYGSPSDVPLAGHWRPTLIPVTDPGRHPSAMNVSDSNSSDRIVSDKNIKEEVRFGIVEVPRKLLNQQADPLNPGDLDQLFTAPLSV